MWYDPFVTVVSPEIGYHRLIQGQFHKAKSPKFVLTNAKTFKAFSMFNFINALTPKFSQHITKK